MLGAVSAVEWVAGFSPLPWMSWGDKQAVTYVLAVLVVIVARLCAACPYPYAFIFRQDEHERLVIDRLSEAGVPVERETEFRGHLDDTEIAGKEAQMNGDDREHQRWIAARHEAGHAIAALHYECPLLHVSIERDGIYVGAARVAEPELPQDAIVLFCGPLAEKDWAEFHSGNNVVIHPAGTDLDGLRRLERLHGDLAWYYTEALLFLSNPAVQQQVDRLGRALLDRNRLTADQARASAEFEEPILPEPHP